MISPAGVLRIETSNKVVNDESAIISEKNLRKVPGDPA